MRWLTALRLRVLRLLKRNRLDRELEEELRFHLEMREQENLASGMRPEDAHLGAARRFGNRTRWQEMSRDLFGFGWLETLAQDVRYGLRGLAKTPGFVLITALSLGLGIGANTTIYSLFKAVMLSEVTAAEAERLVRIDVASGTYSYPGYSELAESGVFSGLAAYTIRPGGGLNWRWRDETSSVFPLLASANFFDVIGVQAAFGRTFTAQEARSETNPQLVVLSHGFWQRRLGGDPSIVGRVLNLNGRPFTVLGILPRGYRSIEIFGLAPEVYAPISSLLLSKPDLESRDHHYLSMFGRLADSVTREQARAGLAVTMERLKNLHPKDPPGRFAIRGVYPISGVDRLLQDREVLPLVAFFGVLAVVVGLVLMIACANVAGLLLARGAARRREIAVRLAIGAGRGRLVQQLLVESALLAALGAGLGLLLNLAITTVMGRVPLPLPFPVEFNLAPDGRLVIYAAMLAAVTILLCGLLPALQSTRPSLTPALKRDEPQLGFRLFRLRNGLVVGQVAVSMLLLLAAVLFVRNLMRIGSADPGFDTHSTLAVEVDLLSERNSERQRETFAQRVIEQLRAVPGVEATANATYLPLSLNNWGTMMRKEGSSEDARFRVTIHPVGHDYFAAMRIPVLRGREFHSADRTGAPLVAVVNESFAKRHYPDGDVLGQRLLEGAVPVEIVGVVRDTKYLTLGEEPRAILYKSCGQSSGGTSFVVRTAVPPASVADAVKQAIGELDATAVVKVQTMRDHLAFAFFPSRVGALLLGTLGMLGLGLAMVGLYGVMAYSVARRTSEIGIRMALGASRATVLRMVLKDGGLLVGAGTAFGLAAALVATKPLAMLLASGLSATDPVTFIGVPLLLAAAGLGACLIPARRAMRVDPMAALRYE